MKKDFYIYAYEHVDDDSEMLSITEDRKQLDLDVKRVKEVLFEAGWQGDGELKLVWIPPFCLPHGHNVGEYVYHVKQATNGTSYIYSRVELEYAKDFEVVPEKSNSTSKYN